MRTDHSAGAVRRRLAKEVGATAAQALLFGFGYLPCRHAPERKRDMRTVVFVHGYGANRASLFPVQSYLRYQGFERQLSYNYSTSTSIEAMGVRLGQVIDDHVRGGQVDLVCHSMGGLVARVYLQMLGGDRRVDRLVTIATPHRGTYSHVYAPTAVAGQMVPDGAFLTHLNGLPAPDVDVTSIAAGEDLIVRPGNHGLAPWGRQVVLDDAGHLDVLFDPRALRAVHDALGPSRRLLECTG